MLEQKTGAIANRRHLRLGELVRTVPMLHPTDSVAKALGHFGGSGLPALPVLEGAFVVGMVSEADLLQWLLEREDAPATYGAELAHDTMLFAVMRPVRTVGYVEDTLDTAVNAFRDTPAEAIPVVDARGAYRGLLTRQTLLATMTRTLKPERIGGMATPFGVYLTTGNLNAGVGPWSLFSTGALFTLIIGCLTAGVSFALEPMFRALPFKAFGAMNHLWPSQANSTMFWLLREQRDLSDLVTAALGLLLFLALLRLSPLSGYHAAEHQTVNAIERNEPLTADAVATMPREHPRCGTNLMALLFGAQLLIPLIAQEPVALLPAALLLALSWRKVGGWLQRVFTTKPARPYQLASGLRAGAALLDAYAANPSYRADKWRRIWNMGLVQVLLGGLSVIATIALLAWIFPSMRGIFTV
ncbi:MAG TPA: DUF1385 domain-containing protein [Oscillatoriaceae cyanobacterium]